jgi:hypothetical protein
MCDLNLIEIALAKLKRNVHENATGDLSLQKLYNWQKMHWHM